jgi:hypothetical protein
VEKVESAIFPIIPLVQLLMTPPTLRRHVPELPEAIAAKSDIDGACSVFTSVNTNYSPVDPALPDLSGMQKKKYQNF